MLYEYEYVVVLTPLSGGHVDLRQQLDFQADTSCLIA